MIDRIEKSRCTGCEACYNACPIDAIQMMLDNEGFYYPIITMETCIRCNKCERSCPLLSNNDTLNEPLDFAVQNENEQIRRESSSGGAFTSIASYVINRGGCVFGAAFDESFKVFHTYAESGDVLSKFRGSKYIQSRIGFSYRKVKQELMRGRLVCFSGTPCQVAGLKRYLECDYDNLLTIDIVCHGIPSPGLFSKYIDYISSKYGQIESIAFRNKRFGYAGSTISISLKNGKSIPLNRDLFFYVDAFFSDLSTRWSCYNCEFKSIYRYSDFTIFDCWHIGKWSSAMDDDKGTTHVLVHSNKARQLFNEVFIHSKYCQVSVSDAVEYDGDMAVKSIPQNPKRISFLHDANSISIRELMDKYLHLTFKRWLIFRLKPLVFKLKLFSILKKLLH